MVTINRSDLEKKLSLIASSVPSTSSLPLLGSNKDGQLTIWQDSAMPIWDGVTSEGDDEFTFSVESNVLRNVITRFKSKSVDLKVNSKKSVVISSGKSRVVVPYCDGPFDEIPEAPYMQKSCMVGKDFLKSLSKAGEFVSKTYENLSLTYSYIGNRDGQFFVAGSGSIYQYANLIPYDGEELPEMIVPPQYASIVPRLFSKDSVQIGLGERQQVVMSDGLTTIYTRSANESYPDTIYQSTEAKGELLFTANKRNLLEFLRLALVTTKEDMIGIGGIEGNLDLYVPNAVLEANLVMEDVYIVKDFPRTYFSLPFLIKCISSFDEDTVKVELLSQLNGAFRIGTEFTTEVAILQPIQYDES